MSKVNHRSTKEKRTMAVRSKLHGTAKRPRLTVFRSNKHIYLQAIDDDKAITLVGVTDAGADKKYKGTKTQKAVSVAKDLAQQLKDKKVKQLVFDRGPYRYHGRVKAVAQTLREQGIEL
ncbi:MAG: 50S ribosomal protein L18 [Candidatus Pacebacteria bacterium]|nr:50S ribosomal protein L18 [Candidatus Paceibacterota bacterium]